MTPALRGWERELKNCHILLENSTDRLHEMPTKGGEMVQNPFTFVVVIYGWMVPNLNVHI